MLFSLGTKYFCELVQKKKDFSPKHGLMCRTYQKSQFKITQEGLALSGKRQEA